MTASRSVTWCGHCGQVVPCAFSVACAAPTRLPMDTFVRREQYDAMRRARLNALLRARSLGVPLRLPAAIYADSHPSWPPSKWQNPKGFP